MPRYQAPLDDIRFVLEDLLDVGQEANMPAYQGCALYSCSEV